MSDIKNQSQPLFTVTRLRVKAIEPTERSYSSRHIEVEIAIPEGGSPRRALDLVDQAVAERLGVPPERLLRAERVLEQLTTRAENAARAAEAAPDCAIRAEKHRARAAEMAARLPEAQAAADAAEHNAAQHRTAGAAGGESETDHAEAQAKLQKTARQARRLADALAQDIDGTMASARYDDEGAERARQTAASSPDPADLAEARAAVEDVKAELDANRADLPF